MVGEGDADAGDADADDGRSPDRDTVEAGRTGPDGDREVVVPLRLYKTVTVFSTLLAVGLVVLGFTFLDAATVQGSVLIRLVNTLPVTVPSPVSEGVLSVVFAAVGLALIALGAGVYVLGSRFRAEGMGTDKPGEAEEEGDG